MLPLVEIDSPEARERGRQYGEQARPQIAVSVEFYKREFELKSGLTWDEVRRRAPQWVPVIEAFHPEALEEVRGISEGSGFAFEEILALNGRGELRTGDPFDVDGCTSFALTEQGSGDGHVYCGQTWDWRVGTKESIVMLHVRQEPKPTIVMQVEAGRSAATARTRPLGLNANGSRRSFGSACRRLHLPPDPRLEHDLRRAQRRDGGETGPARTCSSRTHGYCVDLETTPARHG